VTVQTPTLSSTSAVVLQRERSGVLWAEPCWLGMGSCGPRVWARAIFARCGVLCGLARFLIGTG